MKKLNYLLAAVAVVAMAGCSKEKDVTPASNAVKLHVTVEDTDTRVSIDNAYAYAFQSGDVISVLTDGGAPVAFEASEGGTSVDFTGTFAQGQAIGSYAMYPASGDHMADGDEVLFAIPEDLTWKSNETFMPMLGKINSGTATFKAVGGVMKLIVYNIPASAKYLQFTAPLQQISGWFTIDDASVQAPVIVTDETDASDDTIVIDFSANYSANKVFYIPLPTGTISGFTVSFLDENRDGINGATKTANATLNVTRNKIIIAPALNMGENVVVWSEDFSRYSTGAVPNGKEYQAGSDISYSCTNGIKNGSPIGETKIFNESNAGGTAPELLVCKYGGTFTVSDIPTNGETSMKLTFKQNGYSLTVSSPTSDVSLTGNTSQSTAGTKTVNISIGSNVTQFDLVFTGPSGDKNVRIDDISLTAAGIPYTGPSITVDPTEVTMTITNGDYDTAEATVTYENNVDDLGISVIVDQQTYPWLEFVDLIDGDLCISAPKNLTGASRTGTFTLRATGVTKTVTVTQASTLVPNPEVTINPEMLNAEFEASWGNVEHATGFKAYFSSTDNLEDDPTGEEELTPSYNNETGQWTVSKSGLTNGETYYLYVKTSTVTENFIAPSVYVKTVIEPSDAPASLTYTWTFPVPANTSNGLADNNSTNGCSFSLYTGTGGLSGAKWTNPSGMNPIIGSIISVVSASGGKVGYFIVQIPITNETSTINVSGQIFAWASQQYKGKNLTISYYTTNNSTLNVLRSGALITTSGPYSISESITLGNTYKGEGSFFLKLAPDAGNIGFAGDFSITAE